MTTTYSVFIAVSLDGFIARPNGDIDWLNAAGSDAGDEDYGYRAFMDSVDTLVLGRKTYELALSFPHWPYTGKRVVVLSTGSPRVPDSLSSSVEIMSCPPAECASRLAQSGARHVYVDGGRTIQGFLAAGLIHDLTITRLPVLIGMGLPLFGELAHDITLEHIESKSYPNGFVQSRYRVL